MDSTATERVGSSNRQRRSKSPHRNRIKQILRNGSASLYLGNSGSAEIPTEQTNDERIQSQRGRLQMKIHSPTSNDNTTSTPEPCYRNQQNLETQYRKQYSCPGGTDYTMNAPANGVGAYILQPDGTMAAIRWDDKSALESNRPVLSALKQEQRAQRHGVTTGKIQNASTSKAATLPTDVLNWLAADEETLSDSSNYPPSNGYIRAKSQTIPSPNYNTMPINQRSFPVAFSDRQRSREISSSSSHIDGMPTNSMSPAPGIRNTPQKNSRSNSSPCSKQTPQLVVGDHYQTQQATSGESYTRSSEIGTVKYDYGGNSFRCDTTNTSKNDPSSRPRRNNVRVVQSPGAMQVQSNSAALTNQNVKLSNSHRSPPIKPARRYLSEPTQELHSPTSTMIQKSSWSPEMSSPVRVPAQQRRSMIGTRAMQHTSQQQRQLSYESAANFERHNADKETPVWEFFKYYEHCATSDF